MKQKRIIFIDHIRALAILMVIMCHVIDVNCLFWLGYQEMSGARQIILYTLLIFGRCGVPLFLMITGYLLLDRDYSQGKWKSFYLHKWLHLFLLTEIWFIIYEGFSVLVQGNSFVGKDLVMRLLFIKEPALSRAWYLPVILGLYLILPIVAQLLKWASDRKIALLIGMLLLVMICLQIWQKERLAQHISYLVYTLIGYGLKIWRVNIRPEEYKKWRMICYVVCIGATVGCETYLCLQHLKGQAVSLWYDNIYVMLLACAIFVMFSLCIEKSSPAIQYLSEVSFGIYLIHNMIALAMIEHLLYWDINLYIKIFVSYIGILVASIVIEKLIEAIPMVGKWILYKKR